MRATRPSVAWIGVLPPSVRGQVCMLLSALLMTAGHGIIRGLSTGVHPFEIAFFRNLFALLLLVPVVLRQGMRPLRTKRPLMHALRGGLHTVTMLSLFTGLSLTPLAKAAAINFTTPLFAALGAIALMGERAGAARIVPLLVAFAGVLIVLRPGLEVVGLGPMLMLFSAATWACVLLVTKAIVRTEPSLTVVMYIGVFLTPATFIASLFVWTWPTLPQLGWLLLLGAVSGSQVWFLTQALREADAAAVLPFDFTRLFWAAALGYLLFGEVPDLWVWIGGLLIAGGIIFSAVTEARQDRWPAATPSRHRT